MSKMPAPFTRMSMLPASRATASTMASIEAWSVTSTPSASALPPAAMIAAAVASASAASRSATTASAPSAA